MERLSKVLCIMVLFAVLAGFVCQASAARGRIPGLDSRDDLLVYYGRWNERVVDGNVVKVTLDEAKNFDVVVVELTSNIPYISIDGCPWDWERPQEITALGTDADDMSDNNLDLKAGYIYNDEDYLWIRMDVYGDINPLDVSPYNAYIVYLDTDQDKTTGYAPWYWETGGDYRLLVDGWNVGLQKFRGSDRWDNVWGWNDTDLQLETTNTIATWSEGVLEFRVLRSDIGETNVNEGTNILWQTTPSEDSIPAYAATPLTYSYAGPHITADGGTGDWAGISALGTDSDDVTSSDADLKAGYATNDYDSKYLWLRTDVYGDVNSTGRTYTIYLDTDQNSATGYTGATGWTAVGAEYRVYIDEWNVGLQKFMGNSQSQDLWGWGETQYQLKSITAVSSGGVVEFAIERQDIGEIFIEDATNILWRCTGDGAVDSIPGYTDTPLTITYADSPNGGRITAADVNELKTAGVIVLGYISVGEDLITNFDYDLPLAIGDGNGPVYYDSNTGELVYENNGIASYYLDDYTEVNQPIDGEADRNINYGGCYIDAGNTAWQNRVKTATRGKNDFCGTDEILNDFGCDGLFLDTVDTAGPDYVSWNKEKLRWENMCWEWTAAGMYDMIKQLSEWYPDKYIIPNRGLFFFNPNSKQSDYTRYLKNWDLNPYIDTHIFEGYYVEDSNTRKYNKNDWAPKINAAAGRPDGFTEVCMDYVWPDEDAAVEGPNFVDEVLKGQGWTGYWDGLDFINYYVYNNHALIEPDTAAPIWDSTASLDGNTTPDPRVGIQEVQAGDSRVTLRWDVARDQTIPVKYNVYYGTAADFNSATKLSNVSVQMGRNYVNGTGGTAVYPYEYVINNLVNGTTYYFAVRAEDSNAIPHEDDNAVWLPAEPNIISIIVDGGIDDWNDLPLPALATDDDDVANDDLDLKAGYVTNDLDRLYVRFDVYGDIVLSSNEYVIYLDTDQDGSTGYTGYTDDTGHDWAIGAEYRLLVSSGGVGLQEFMDSSVPEGTWGWNGAPGLEPTNTVYSWSDSVWEFSVLLSDIGETVTDGAIDVLWRIGNDSAPVFQTVATYEFNPVTVINLDVNSVERGASNYSGAACLKMALDFEETNSYTQAALHSYGISQNNDPCQTTYINPRGMYLAMNNYELHSSYNYGSHSLETLTAAYHDLCKWIAYNPSVPEPYPDNMPAMIPLGGSYANWVIVNGFRASDNPWISQPWTPTTNYTVHGFWLTDPNASGIGENVYRTAADLENDFIALNTGDAWDAKYVTICEPPEGDADVSIAEPVGCGYELSSKSDVIDAAVDGLWDNVLDFDEKFMAAYTDSRPSKPILVRSSNSDYYIVPFVKRTGCSVAVIIDAETGAFKQASYCDMPDVKYLKRFGKSAIRKNGKSAKHQNAFLPNIEQIEILEK